jgi:hypothetical protein
MSRLIFWNETDIIKETVYRQNECKYKVNNICFNNMSFEKLGKICHGCEDFTEEDNKVTKW